MFPTISQVRINVVIANAPFFVYFICLTSIVSVLL